MAHLLGGVSQLWSARLWDLATGKTRYEFPSGIYRSYSAAFSPNGRYLAVGRQDATICLYDVATGHETLVLTGHTGGVLGLAWSPDGKMLISGSADSKVKLWDVSNLR